MGNGGHDQDRGHRQQHDPTAVEKRRVLIRPTDQEGDDDQPDDSRTVQKLHTAYKLPTPKVATPKLTTPKGEVRAKAAARPHHGQGGTHEQAKGAGVGSLVDPRGVGSRLVKQRHGGGREGRGRKGQDSQPVAPTDVTQAEPEQPRPDKVKLLLYRQGPQVVERWRRPEAREVGDVAEDVPPVAYVDGGRDSVPPESRQLGWVQQCDPRHHY